MHPHFTDEETEAQKFRSPLWSSLNSVFQRIIPPPTQLHKPNELAYEYKLALINPFTSFISLVLLPSKPANTALPSLLGVRGTGEDDLL